jgi:hypothetical protein
MGISKFSKTTLSTKTQALRSVVGTNVKYLQTYTGGDGWVSELGQPWASGDDGTITKATGQTVWSNLLTNQGTYYGGSQTTSGGGIGIMTLLLNDGKPLPAGKYRVDAVVQLEWASGGDSHDGMYMWAVSGSGSKERILQAVRPPDQSNTELTKSGQFTIGSDTTVTLWIQIADGSSASAMGGRVYSVRVAQG